MQYTNLLASAQNTTLCVLLLVLKIVKNIAVYSSKFCDARVNNPNGPIPPGIVPPFWEHMFSATVSAVWSSCWARFKFEKEKTTSTSACQNKIMIRWEFLVLRMFMSLNISNKKNKNTWTAVIPFTSMRSPCWSATLLIWTFPSRSSFTSSIGHCNNCLPLLSSHVILGIAWNEWRRVLRSWQW